MPYDNITSNITFGSTTADSIQDSNLLYSHYITSDNTWTNAWDPKGFSITIDPGDSESVRRLLEDALNGCNKKEPNMEKEKNSSNKFAVKHIDFGRKTTVYWEDGTQTVVRCARDTEFSEYAAFTAALAKKIYGTNTAINKLVRDKDLRRIKAEERQANLEAQRERERIAEKKRRQRIRRMAKKMMEENEAKRIAMKKETFKEVFGG